MKVGEPAPATPTPSPTESVEKQAGGAAKGDAVVEPPATNSPTDTPSPTKTTEKSKEPAAPAQSAQSKALELCKKYFADAKRADLSFLKGTVATDGTGCTVKDAEILVQGWLEATDVNVSLTGDAVTIESGKVTLPKQWGAPELKVEEPIKIDLRGSRTDTDAKITGALSGKGLPFGDQLGGGFSDAKITVKLTDATSEVSVAKEGVPPLVEGTVSQGGFFSLAVNVPDSVDLGTLGKASLVGSIANTAPTAAKQVKELEKLSLAQRLAKAKFAYDVKGSVTDVSFGDSVKIPTLTVQATSSGDYAASGEAQVAVPDQDPLVVAATGTVAKGIVTISGKTEMPGWSFLPGTKFGVNAKDVVYDTKAGKLQSGTVDAQALSDVPLGSSPVALASGSDVSINLGTGAVSFDGAALVSGPEGVTRVAGSGSYAKQETGSKLNVTFEQKADDPALQLGSGSSASGVKVVVDRISQPGQPGDLAAHLSAQSMNIQNFVTFKNATLEATKDSITVKQGTEVGLPPDWGITGIAITKDVAVPLSGGAKPTGEIVGKGVPFVPNQDVQFTVSLAENGTNSLSAKGNGVDFNGTVTAAGAYDLQGSVDTGSVKTKIACAAPDIKKADWTKCTGSVHFGPIASGPLQVDEVAISKDTNGSYPVTVDARVNMDGQEPTTIRLTGVYQKVGNVQTVTADASGTFDWSFLPGTFTAGGKGLSFENTGSGWNLKAGTLALSTQNATVVPGLFALPTAAVNLDLASKQFTAEGSVAAAGKPLGSIAYDSAAKKLALTLKQGAEAIAVDGVGSLAGLDGTIDITWPDTKATVAGHLAGGTVSIDDTFVVDAKSISFDNNGATLGAGTSISTPDWGINATVPEGQTVEIRSEQGKTNVKGSLQASGLPFANKLPLGDVSDVSTTVSFGDDPTTVKVTKSGVETPLMDGTIAANGATSVTLALKDGGTVSVPGFGQVSLSGTVTRAAGVKQPVAVSGVSGRVDQLSLAEGLVTGGLGITVADGTGVVSLDGSVAVNIPGQDPVVVAVADGKYDSAAKLVSAREVTAEGIKIPGLGGDTSFKVSSNALTLPLDKSAKATGVVTVGAQSLTLVPDVAAVKDMTLSLNLGTKDVGFAGQVVAGGLPLAASGSYVTKDGSSTFTVNTTQVGDKPTVLAGGAVTMTGLGVNASRVFGAGAKGWSGSLIGTADVQGLVTVDAKQIDFNESGIVVGKDTKVSLPADWQMPEFTVSQDVKIPSTPQGQFSGQITANGVPFADALGLGDSAKEYTFTVTWNEDKSKSLKADGPSGLTFNGTITAANRYEIDASYNVATVKCSGDVAMPDWSKCSAGLMFGPIDAGPLQVKAASLTREGSTNTYKVDTTAEVVTGDVRSPITIKGSYDDVKKTATVTASGEIPGGSLLPGATLTASGEELVFTKSAQGWATTSGVVTAAVTGDVPLVPGVITARGPKVIVNLADKKVTAEGAVVVGGSKVGDLAYDGGASPAQLNVTLNQEDVPAVLPGGITATGLKGHVTRTLGPSPATTMTLDNGALDMSGIATLNAAGLSYDGSKITVGKDTKLAANPAWGLPELSAASDIVLTPQTTGTQIAGAITAAGLPFASTLPVAGANDITTTITFATGQPTNIAVNKAGAGDVINGVINTDSSFDLTLDATGDRAITVNNFGTISLGATISRAPPTGTTKAPVEFKNLLAKVTNASIADGLVKLDNVEFTAPDASGKTLKIEGSGSINVPDQASASVSLGGTYSDQKLNLTRVSATNVSLPALLPNTALGVLGTGVQYDFAKKQVTDGVVTLTADGKTELFPGAVSLANAKLTIGLVTKAITFGADFELPGKSGKPITQVVTANYKVTGQEPKTSELSLKLDGSTEEAMFPGDVTLTGLNGNVVGRFGGSDAGWAANLGVANLSIASTFAVTGTKLGFDSNKLVIESGNVALPEAWQMPVLSVTSPITIPLGANSTDKFSGEISGKGFPFAKTLNAETQTKDATFTVAFMNDGSRKLSVDKAAGVTFNGAINANDSYKLDGEVSVAPVNVKVSCEGPNIATPDWAACGGSTSIEKQKLGPLYIDKVEATKEKGPGQLYGTTVSAFVQIPGQSDAPITATGTWDKATNVIKLTATGTVAWSFLPGNFTVDGRDIVIEKPGGQWKLSSGSLDLTTNADLVPGVIRAENAKVAIDLATSAVTASGDVVVGAAKVGAISYTPTGDTDNNGKINVELDQQTDATLGAVTASGLKGNVDVQWKGTGAAKTRVVNGNVKAGTIGLENVVSVSANGVTFNGDGVTIGPDSEIAFNEEWGLPKAKASGKGITITGTSAKPEVSGEVTVVGIPFAKNLGIGDQAADVNTKIGFGGSTATVKVAKGDEKPLIDGTVANGLYTLTVAMPDTVNIPGFGNGSANGTITNADEKDAKKKAATRYNVNLKFTDIKLGDQVKINTLEGDANSQGVYNLTGTAALGGEASPQIINISADIDPAKINFSGTTELPEWSQLPGMKLTAIVNFNLDRAAKSYSGDIGLKGEGSMSYAQDKVKLTSPSVKYVFNQSGGTKVEAGGDLEIASMVASAAPLKMPATGTVDLTGKAASFSLKATQTGEQAFLLADGVEIKGTELEFAYNPAPVAEEGKPLPEKFTASFKSNAGVTIPMPSGDQTASAIVEAKYSATGLEFKGKWDTDKWELGQGVDLTNLQIGYRSSYGKSDLTPELGEFNGLAVAAKMNPGDGSFLADTVGMEGEHNAIARIDPSTKTFDVAVVSDGKINLAQGEGYSVEVAKPYLKASYASAGTGQPKKFTVALGGTGSFTYKDPVTNTDQKLENLAFGAAYDSAARTITGSLKLKDWQNAAGIQGLTIGNGSVDVSSVPDPANEGKRKLTASVFALVGETDAKPAFLTKLGVDKNAAIALGVGFGKGVCSMLSIGRDAPGADIALRPFHFAGDTFQDVLQVRYASFVTATGPCKIGDHEVKGSAMQLRGSLLGQLPLETDLNATQAPGGQKVELVSTADSGKIASASLGAATVDNAQVGIALNTDEPKALGPDLVKDPEAYKQPASKESPGVSFAGSLPIGKQKLDVAGRASFADGKVKLNLGAKSDELALGSFKVKNPVVEAGVSFIIKDKKLGDDFSLKAKGDAQMLGTTARVGIDMAYAGGTVSAFTGTIGVPKGLKVGSNVVVKGDGSIGWTSTAGLSVNIGSQDVAASKASVEVCSGEAREVTTGAEKGAECSTANNTGLTNAYLTVKPGGFSTAGTLKLGDTITARVNGAYWSAPDGSNDKIEFAGQNYIARAGDFSFGVNDAKITMPTGQVSASVALAKFSRNGEEINGARLGFQTPVLNGRVGFDGTFDSAGRYTATGTAQNISLGGFKIDDGKATVSNATGSVAVKLDLKAKILGTTDINFKGEYANVNGAVGVRMRGDLKIAFASGTEGTGSATYSNYPEDAGFGLGFKMKIAGGTEVEFEGVLRKVSGETLYRVKGAVAVPVSPGVVAGGMVQLDNCEDTDGYACTIARKTGNNETTPLLTIGASAKVGGGLIEITVKGSARFDGAFRLVGEGRASRHFGPYDFGIASAEAGFSMYISACMANEKATQKSGNASLMGCGNSQDQTWQATLDGNAWIKGTVGRGWFSKSGQIDVGVRGRMGPTESKYCAFGSFIGMDFKFGECP